MTRYRRALRSLALSGALAAALVAGSARATVPAGRYRVTTETVFDTETRLTWERAGTFGLDWAAANAYCSALTLGGLPAGSWRLPTLRELLGLVDVRPTGTIVIDPVAFPGWTWLFWSSTPVAGDAAQAWAIGSSGGTPSANAKTDASLNARCVR